MRTRKPADAYFPTRRDWTLNAVCYVNEVDGSREVALLPRGRSGRAQHLNAASMRRLSAWLSRAAAWKEVVK